MKKLKKPITAEEFDRIFDEGKEDIMQYMDPNSAKVIYPQQRINVDFPVHILAKLDREADRIGVTRTSLIKMWIAERLTEIGHPAKPSL